MLGPVVAPRQSVHADDRDVDDVHVLAGVRDRLDEVGRAANLTIGTTRIGSAVDDGVHPLDGLAQARPVGEVPGAGAGSGNGGSGMGSAAERAHLVTTGEKPWDQEAAEMTAGTGDEN